MKQGLRRGAALLLLLPSAGCVFAVGGDDEGNEELRDRVRALEQRIDRLEGGPREFGGRSRKEFRLGEDAPRVVPGAPK